ncbi:hypothetical protein HWV62_12514 [Athelia sp. TMB]|nr:hypothetical protein HWV62_12514 [Athelia sp. TMB]
MAGLGRFLSRDRASIDKAPPGHRRFPSKQDDTDRTRNMSKTQKPGLTRFLSRSSTQESSSSSVGRTAREMDEDDPNFCFPIRELANAKVRLTPFIPSQHAAAFFAASAPHPTLYTHLPFGPFPTLPDFLAWYDTIHASPTSTLFAIIARTDPYAYHDEDDSAGGDRLAGLIAYTDAAPAHRSVALGPALVLPPFQRTHVARCALALLLRYAFDPLGLRRVTWRADAEDAAGVRAAQRVGFGKEMAHRWNHAGGDGDWDTVMLAVCWADWDVDVRELVRRILDE